MNFEAMISGLDSRANQLLDELIDAREAVPPGDDKADLRYMAAQVERATKAIRKARDRARGAR